MNTHETQEQWRDIPRYEGLYKVSDMGRVLNIKTQRIIGCNTPASKRHIQVGLTKNGKTWSFGVHQLVMLAFVGLCPYGMEVNHKNHVKYDNRLSNLEYVTHQENIKLASDLGLMRKKHADTRARVRELYDQGVQSSVIAVQLGISAPRVQQILAKFGISVKATKPRRPPYQKKPKLLEPETERGIRILQMYRNGMTTTAIARDLDITLQQVSTTLGYWLPKEERRNKRRTSEETAINHQRILELASQGHSIKAIAELTSNHYTYVNKFLKANQ
jgi:DNA-binding CsgD family transcriptional regulator